MSKEKIRKELQAVSDSFISDARKNNNYKGLINKLLDIYDKSGLTSPEAFITKVDFSNNKSKSPRLQAKLANLITLLKSDDRNLSNIKSSMNNLVKKKLSGSPDFDFSLKDIDPKLMNRQELEVLSDGSNEELKEKETKTNLRQQLEEKDEKEEVKDEKRDGDKEDVKKVEKKQKKEMEDFEEEKKRKEEKETSTSNEDGLTTPPTPTKSPDQIEIEDVKKNMKEKLKTKKQEQTKNPKTLKTMESIKTKLSSKPPLERAEDIPMRRKVLEEIKAIKGNSPEAINFIEEELEKLNNAEPNVNMSSSKPEEDPRIKTEKVERVRQPNKIDEIPNSRLSVDFKDKKELMEDIKYFFDNFGSVLKSEQSQYRSSNKNNIDVLKRIHKKIVGRLQVDKSKSNKRMGVILSGDDFIKQKINEILLSKQMAGTNAKDLTVDIESKEKKDSDVNDIGLYEVKTASGGREAYRREPVYRLMPSENDPFQNQRDDRDTKDRYQRLNTDERLSKIKTKPRSRIDGYRRQAKANPFIKLKSDNRRLKYLF